jgi:hypothetical protein
MAIHNKLLVVFDILMMHDDYQVDKPMKKPDVDDIRAPSLISMIDPSSF